MSRLEEVEASIKWIMSAGMTGGAITPNMRDLCRTLAAEVDARDAVIAEILAMLEPMPQEKFYTLRYAEDIIHEDCCRELHRRACEIAGRTE